MLVPRKSWHNNLENQKQLLRTCYELDPPSGVLPSTSILTNLKKSLTGPVRENSLYIHADEPGSLLVEVVMAAEDLDETATKALILQSIPGTPDVQITSVDGNESIDLRMIPNECEALSRALDLCADWQRAERASLESDQDD